VDLKAETLSQIVEGVRDAQSRTEQHCARVSPSFTASAELVGKQGFLIASGDAAQMVQFDVAISAKEGTGTKGGIGLIVGPVTLGSAGQSTQESSGTSRVKFCVPLVLPLSG